MSQQNDSSEDCPDFQDLETKLSRLEPIGPSDLFARRLGHRLDAMERDRHEKKVVWVRFAPVAAAACVVLTSAYLFREHLIRQAAAETAAANREDATGITQAPVIDDDSTNPRLRSSIPASGFVPVARENLVRGAWEGSLIRTEGGGSPLREYFLDIEDSQLWYEPETETNLRILSGREGVLYLPVETD